MKRIRRSRNVCDSRYCHFDIYRQCYIPSKTNSYTKFLSQMHQNIRSLERLMCGKCG